MKRISKQPPPKELEVWRRKDGGPGRKLTYGQLPSEIKQLTLRALEQEQGDLCCYCMRRIPPSDIEHIRPQSKCRNGEDVDYQNLLASCHSPGGVSKIPDSCNHKRGNKPLRVSPLQPDCEEHFRFELTGEIGPSAAPRHQDAAQVTIALLGLNNALLIRQRASAISGLKLADLSFAEIRKMRDHFSRRNSKGQLAPFAAALLFVLSEWEH